MGRIEKSEIRRAGRVTLGHFDKEMQLQGKITSRKLAEKLLSVVSCVRGI